MGTRMNSREASTFDLSPSEKLQLVEDLWDDLAATPRLCQSTTGKSKSLTQKGEPAEKLGIPIGVAET
jgi:hypothetical protein